MQGDVEVDDFLGGVVDGRCDGKMFSSAVLGEILVIFGRGE